MPDTPHHASSEHPGRPLVIGLTGGIGSGKSTVAGYFSDLGVTVVDADRLARELVRPGQPALAEIRAAFGKQAMTAEGTLDRDFLRQRIHSNPEDKHKLESILHPRIRRRMEQRLDQAGGAYSIAVIPLLLEAGQRDLVDRVLVVDSPESLQRRRVRERDGLPDATVANIMANQADRETRLSAADDIISNDSDLETLRNRVNALHQAYLACAST